MPEPHRAGNGGEVGDASNWCGAVEPGPDSQVIPVLAAIRVRLATVAAMYNWNRVLTRPK